MTTRHASLRRILTGLYLGACIACAREPDRPLAQGASLEIGYSALRISLPLLVAQSRGLFASRGLAVTLKRYETAQPLVEDVLDGRLLAGGYAALPIVFTAASRGGTRPALISAVMEDETHPISYLLKRRGAAPIENVADLRGKRVGVLPTLAYQKWLAAILSEAGLAVGDVHVVPLAPAQQVSGLAEGVVDALFTNDPMATSALERGAAERLGPVAPLVSVVRQPVWFGSMLAHERLLRERPQDAEKLVAAIDEAIGYVHADQAAARRMLSPFLRDSERAYVERYPASRYLRSAEIDSARLGSELRLQVRLGAIEPPADPQGWVWPGRGGAP